MSSFKKLGFLAIALIVSGQIMAMGTTPNPAFNEALKAQLLTPAGSPSGSDNGDGLPRPATAGKGFGKCLKAREWLKEKGTALTERFQNNPKIRAFCKIGSMGVFTAVTSNQWRTEYPPHFLQHATGKLIDQELDAAGFSFPEKAVLIYPPLIAAAVATELALLPTKPLDNDAGNATSVNATSADDDYYGGVNSSLPLSPSNGDNDAWADNPNNGYKPGAVATLSLAFVHSIYKAWYDTTSRK